MYVTVNGARLFFDVDGAKLVPDGPRMRERPTLLLLHGGPGGDHSTFKPRFSHLADIAQLVYLDHRGNGRSTWGDPASWTLAQWGDDVRAFCDALGIEKPIVLGYSFGGMVAQAYATRHPEHPGKLVFYSTSPKVERDESLAVFARLGGERARAVAAAWFDDRNRETSAAYREVCFPLYNRRGTHDPDAAERVLRNEEVSYRFGAPNGEALGLDFCAALGRVQCPTLVVGGEDDPITPIGKSQLLASSLPPHLVRFERFANAGHGPHIDDPERTFAVLREFILA
ncbi:MAG: alpha/beta hydrolase [Acidisphaera sp.]|nr:alpha/beta hydrolase [Acidisphaera sp.]MBV9811762.1 alpha/beta hydrolase [Acetobacteraceae bacterium]